MYLQVIPHVRYMIIRFILYILHYLCIKCYICCIVGSAMSTDGVGRAPTPRPSRPAKADQWSR